MLFFSVEFALSRGHGIERKNYIDDLHAVSWAKEECQKL